mgnify:CR=1 FL=1
MSGNVIGTVIGGFLALCGVVFTALQGRKVGEIDGWDRLAQRHESEIRRLDERLSIAEHRLDFSGAVIRWWANRVDQLVGFVRSVGHEPPDPHEPYPVYDEEGKF